MPLSRMRSVVGAGVALVLLGSVSSGQTRERPEVTPLAGQQPRCSARVRTVAPQRARPEANTAPALVLVDDGALLTWLADDGTLFLTRLDASYERRADDRELAHPARSFAMIGVSHGAVVAYAERTRAGDDVVLLARLNAAGEARNVPRELGRGMGIDSVTLAPTPNGFAVAWSTRDPQAAGTHIVLTDPRGIPLGAEHSVTSATTPRLVYLPTAQTLVLAASGGPGDPVIATVDGEAVLGETNAWTSAARGLTTSTGGNAAIALVSSGIDASGAGLFSITRFTPGDGVSATPFALRVTPNTTPMAVLGDRAGAIVLLDDGVRRETLSRVAADGSVTLLAVRNGHAGSIVATSDGYVLAGLQPAEVPTHGIDLVSLSCPRPPPAPATAAANGASTTGTTAVVPDAGTSDSGMSVTGTAPAP